MRAFAPFLIAAVVFAGAAQGQEPVGQTLAQRGQSLVAANCSSCHAVGASESSATRTAPAFRTIAQIYPVAHLEEALAEGLSVGAGHEHEALQAGEVRAIVAYLETIQTEQTPQQRRTPPAVG